MAKVEQTSFISCEDGVEFVRVSTIYSKVEWEALEYKPITLDEVKVIKWSK